MVRIVPLPSTSMAPPSSTTGRPLWIARRSSRSRAFATRSATWSSFLWSGYLAQPLKRKRATATSGSGCSRRTPMGPKSRVQPRSVGQRKNSTRPVAAETRSRTRRAFVSCAFEGTRMRTISPSASLRTISP